MTVNGNIKIKSEGSYHKKRRTFFVLLAWLSLIFAILISEKISKYVRVGLELCTSTVISSVFPFLILTDLISSTPGFEEIRVLRKLFERAFKINGYAINSFLIGITCGFPIGAKSAAELYKNRKISKEECERLIGFCNNTGPAFIISGIGAAMRGSILDGVLLYLTMIISAIIVGIIFGIGKSYSQTRSACNNLYFDFPSSVKNAATNTLGICGFVVLFSVICGIISDFLKTSGFLFYILPFIEVTNAASILEKSTTLPKAFSLMLTSFSISFSGLSVHFQTSSFLRGLNISMKKYYLMKLAQGAVSSLLTLAIILIIG